MMHSWRRRSRSRLAEITESCRQAPEVLHVRQARESRLVKKRKHAVEFQDGNVELLPIVCGLGLIVGLLHDLGQQLAPDLVEHGASPR